MPAQIAIAIEGDDVTVSMLGAYPERTTVALVRALNRGIASGRTVMVRAIASDTGLKSTDVRNALVMREADRNTLAATLGASLKRLPLIQFNARGPEPSKGKGRGVTYRLQGSSNRAPNAFIATMGSGHRGVFARVRRSRLPIKELFGPSLGHVFAKYRADGLARAQEAFLTNFDHEMSFAGSEGASGTD